MGSGARQTKPNWDDMTPEEKEKYLEEQKQAKIRAEKYAEEERRRKKITWAFFGIAAIILIIVIIVIAFAVRNK